MNTEKKPSPARKLGMIRSYWNKILQKMSLDKREVHQRQIEVNIARQIVAARDLRKKEFAKRKGLASAAKTKSEFNRLMKYMKKENRFKNKTTNPTKHQFHDSEIKRVKKILFGSLVTE